MGIFNRRRSAINKYSPPPTNPKASIANKKCRDNPVSVHRAKISFKLQQSILLRRAHF